MMAHQWWFLVREDHRDHEVSINSKALLISILRLKNSLENFPTLEIKDKRETIAIGQLLNLSLSR
jgi:hypothetical protein